MLRSGFPPKLLLIGLYGLFPVLACGRGADSVPASLGLRPGDTLLEALDTAVVEVGHGQAEFASTTNLPDEIAELLAAPFNLRTRPFPPTRWAASGLPAEPHLREIVDKTNARYWSLKPQIHPHVSAGPPRILQSGEPVPEWDGSFHSFPGNFVWWDSTSRTLHALSNDAPEGVSLKVLTDPTAEFGIYERGWIDTPEPTDPVVPVFYGKVRGVTRRSLLLPSPGTIEFQFERLSSSELRVAVGVADRSWVRVGDNLERIERGSDGAVFAVEARVGDKVERLWSFHVGRKQVGRRFFEGRVDLSRYTNKSVSLRLVTEPGPDGDRFFDYGLWADLRLAGNASRKPSRPHIVLIDVDTLRADRMSAYGYLRATTPRIKAWADNHALRFDDAIALAPWTLPSTVSMLTGLAVHQHGIDDSSKSLTERIPTIAARLATAGYETRGLTGGGYVRSAFGFHLGFDLYDERWFREPPVDKVLEWIRHRQSERPLFLFVQTYLPHAPYPADERFADPDSPYRGPLHGRDVTPRDVLIPHNKGTLELDTADRAYINALYDALVNRVDESIGELLEELELVLANQPFLVILTSDHGEEFWEHGQMGHGHSMYDEQLRVPLLVRFPGNEDVPALVGVSSLPVSTLDVVPTILDAAGLTTPESLPGSSLRSQLPENRVRLAQRGVSGWRALTWGSHKLILGQGHRPLHSFGPIALYDLERDPTELDNLRDVDPARVDELSQILNEYLEQWTAPEESGPGASAIDEALRDELEALGYVEDANP